MVRASMVQLDILHLDAPVPADVDFLADALLVPLSATDLRALVRGRLCDPPALRACHRLCSEAHLYATSSYSYQRFGSAQKSQSLALRVL